MSKRVTHTITVSRNFLGDHVPACSCGWSDEFGGHETNLAALGAGDRHVAAAIS